MARVDVAVIGAGPNGLTAAVTLAVAGLEVHVYEAADSVGGGARTAELTLPGFRHDVCSAVHPLGAGSPALRALPLERYGLSWVDPQLPLAHPFPDGSAAAMPVSRRGRGGASIRSCTRASPVSWIKLCPRTIHPGPTADPGRPARATPT